MEEAAAQEGVGQLLLVIRGDDHHRPDLGPDGLVGLVDIEFHAIELLEEVVRELDVCLVDLVDQQDRALRGREALPELALLDVVADVLDPLFAQLAVAQAGHGVVLVEALMSLGRGLDVPGDQLGVEGLGDLVGQHGLAGTRLALDQKGALEGDGGVDGHLQVIGGNVVLSAFKTLAHLGSPERRPAGHPNKCFNDGGTLKAGPRHSSRFVPGPFRFPARPEAGRWTQLVTLSARAAATD